MDISSTHGHAIYLVTYGLAFLSFGFVIGSMGPIIPYLSIAREVP